MLDGLLQSVCYAGDLSGQYLAQRTAVSILYVNGGAAVPMMIYLLDLYLPI